MADWRASARCRGEDPNLFHVEDTIHGGRHRALKPTKRVQDMCAVCPVEGECLAEALRNNEHGIWGGTTDSQRAQMKKARWRISCITCGGRTIVRSRTYAVCMSCGLSWRAPTPRPSQAAEPPPTPPSNATLPLQSSTVRPRLALPRSVPLAA